MFSCFGNYITEIVWPVIFLTTLAYTKAELLIAFSAPLSNFDTFQHQ